jgi:hypothetical protein
MTRAAARLVIALSLFLSACAPSSVQTDYESVPKLARPDTILVYDFAVSADEVQLDSGVVGKVEAKASGQPRTEQELEVGHKVAGIISEALNIADHKKYKPGTGHSFAGSISGDVGSFHPNLLVN